MKILHYIAIILGISGIIMCAISREWSTLSWAICGTVWPISSLGWYNRYIEEKYKNKTENKQ